MDKFDYTKIPEDTMRALERWRENGETPSGFLLACLEDKLNLAVGRADSHNLPAIPMIAMYLYNRMPADCWGDKEKVSEWRGVKYLEYVNRVVDALNEGGAVGASSLVSDYAKHLRLVYDADGAAQTAANQILDDLKRCANILTDKRKGKLFTAEVDEGVRYPSELRDRSLRMEEGIRILTDVPRDE
jgi:hypothetical protein